MIDLHAAVEVGAGAVKLVDEAHARHAVLVGLAPHGFRLRLDAGNAVEAGDRAVEHAQRTLDFNGEVDVARGVDDVDAVVVPEAGRGGRRDRDAALLLLLHPVHGGGAFMHFADLVGLAGVIEDALGRRRLAGVDVRHDADIAITVERSGAGHVSSTSKRFAAPPENGAVIGYQRCCNTVVTSGSARRRGWLRPCGAYLHAS